MREKSLIKEIEYNTQYKVIGDKMLDGNNYISSNIKLIKNVYSADELVDIDEKTNKSVIDVVNNFSQTFQSRGGATHEQIHFAKETAKIIFGQLKENISVVIPAPCGFGKSSISLEIIAKAIELNKNGISDNGLILVTDRLDSLRETQKALEQRGLSGYAYILEGWNETICKNKKVRESNSQICKKCPYVECKIHKQHEEQKDYPILLITNARLRETSTNIKQYSTYNKGNRTILLIDERPDVLDSVKVNKAFLNLISTEISKCVYNDTLEKTVFENMFKKIKDQIIDKMQNLRKSYKRFIISTSNNEPICKTDEEFMKLWDKYMKNNCKRELDHIHIILTKGGFYVYEKNTEFIATIGSRDFRDMYSDSFKTIIFDGTALYDPLYLKMYEQQSIKYLDVENTRIYDNLEFKIYLKHKLTKSNFNGKGYLVKACAKFANDRLRKGIGNKAYIITYQSKAVELAKWLKNDNKIIPMPSEGETYYFGATKGKNTMQDCNIMFQFGWDTLPDYEYIIQWLSIVTDWEKVLKHCSDSKKVKEFCDNLLTIDRSKTVYGDKSYSSQHRYFEFGFESINQLKYFMIITNFYQEVHRTKLRQYNCTKEKIEVNIFLIKSIVYSMIEQLFPGCTINRIKEELISFKESKITGRETKDGNDSISQKILNWLNEKWSGEEIKTKNMLKEIGITQKQFDKAKEYNNSLKSILSKYMVKRGIYKKVS